MVNTFYFTAILYAVYYILLINQYYIIMIFEGSCDTED